MKLTAKPHYSLLSLFLLLCCCTIAVAKEEPINIAADHMTATEKTNSVVFSGNVDASQGDVKIRAEKMEVFYSTAKKSAKTKKAKQQVEKMICTGDVEITKGKWLGTADRMDYLERKRKVILSGNAKAWQDKNMVNGSKIIYYLDEGRSEVVAAAPAANNGGKKSGKSGRVQMTILQN